MSPEPSSGSRGLLSYLGGATSRWPAFGAVLVVIVAQASLARELQLEPDWLLPGIAAVLLIASVAFYLAPRKPRRLARLVAVGLSVALALANAGSLALLVRGVFVHSTLTPLHLLASGVAVWVVNLLVFAIVYWELDGGGPEARLERARELPDLVFPQQQADQQGLAPPDWQPSFGDYLYVSLTNATAFSPTDTLPYSRPAKLAMGVQALMSFSIAALLVARAVNVAKG